MRVGDTASARHIATSQREGEGKSGAHIASVHIASLPVAEMARHAHCQVLDTRGEDAERERENGLGLDSEMTRRAPHCVLDAGEWGGGQPGTKHSLSQWISKLVICPTYAQRAGTGVP